MESIMRRFMMAVRIFNKGVAFNEVHHIKVCQQADYFGGLGWGWIQSQEARQSEAWRYTDGATMMTQYDDVRPLGSAGWTRCWSSWWYLRSRSGNVFWTKERKLDERHFNEFQHCSSIVDFCAGTSTTVREFKSLPKAQVLFGCIINLWGCIYSAFKVMEPILS